MSALTPQQANAIIARGNVLVAAGAGTGKTSTLTARCLHLVIEEGCRLDQILMVTFTEAAAAEMRERLRRRLRESAAAVEPADSELAGRLGEEIALLDTAPISTLHSFCLDLVRRNFHTLGLDPQLTVLDEQQTKPLIHAVLDDLFERHCATGAPGSDPARANGQCSGLCELIAQYAGGRADAIRRLIVDVHHHTQALASPERWFEQQLAVFRNVRPTEWQQQLVSSLRDWAALWLEALAPTAEVAGNVAACRKELLGPANQEATLAQANQALEAILAADATERWPKGQKTKLRKPIERFFADAAFLAELVKDDGVALTQDWAATRGHMLALLELAREFTAEFTRAKRELGGIDFADQEQLALRLLYTEDGRLTPVAHECRERFKFVFVDECQDINAAQDAILRAVSRDDAEANRFLVGDVKQSIYRFRLADPRIFQNYERNWQLQSEPLPARGPSPGLTATLSPSDGKRDGVRGGSPSAGRVLPLSENFRSHERLLRFINPLFHALMRPALGGLHYDANAELQFGGAEERDDLRVKPGDEPRVELHIITKDNSVESGEDLSEPEGDACELADLQSTEREARLIAQRFKTLRESSCRIWNRDGGGFIPVEYRDMVVLMRSVAGRAEIFAKAFHQAGVPLHAERAGFLDSLEITDLLSLLRLLDNPLQDVPLLTVLRSQFVGMSPEELVQVRLAQPRGLLWFALNKLAGNASQPAATKAATFLEKYSRWRELIRHAVLSHCLETALAETYYEPLLLAGERGEARVANVRRFIELARRFDPFRREGLFRFLQFVAEQEEAEVRHRPAASTAENAVRLMTIHASKGLEFSVVALAGLGIKFNLRELGGDILLNEDLGLCPRVVAAESRRRYPSIAHWAAAQRERQALLGEEMRLLYVALTRARDMLILTGTATRKDEIQRWQPAIGNIVSDLALLRAGNSLEWLRLWFTQSTPATDWTTERTGANRLLRWEFDEPGSAAFHLRPVASEVREADAPTLPSAAEVAVIRSRIGARYPHAAATIEPAKASVSGLRRRAAERVEESRILFGGKPLGRTTRRVTGKLSAAEIGSAHHAFMQFVDLDCVGSEPELHNEAARMQATGALLPGEIAALDFPALLAFWQSDVGQRFRGQAPARIHRELPFTARMSARDLRSLDLPLASPALADEEFVVVQGVVDLAAITESEIWLLDFKTDHVNADALAAKVKLYEPQLKLYALALARIYRRPVTQTWLHFLATGATEPIRTRD